MTEPARDGDESSSRLRRSGPWLALLVGGALLAGLLLRSSSPEDARPGTTAAIADTSPTTSESPAADDPSRPAEGWPVAQSTRDRAVRDALRRRIWTAWNQRGPAIAPPGADPLHAPIPARDEPLDAQYLRARIREDFIPMAQVCYDSFLTRRPGVGGTLQMDFTLVGEAGLGGVVDEAEVHSPEVDGGFAPDQPWDPEFFRCLRESLLTVAFRPPPASGRLRVRYPLTLSPESPDGGS